MTDSKAIHSGVCDQHGGWANRTTNQCPVCFSWQRLDELEGELESAQHGILTRAGWVYTSATPDFCWRWVKALPDGTKLMVDTKSALSIEQNGGIK